MSRRVQPRRGEGRRGGEKGEGEQEVEDGSFKSRGGYRIKCSGSKFTLAVITAGRASLLRYMVQASPWNVVFSGG